MNAKPVSHNSSAAVAETILGVMTELATVLVDEVKLLKKQDIAAIQALLRRKNKLIIDYHSKIKSIAANPELVAKASVETRAKLKAVGARLAEVSEQNAFALRGAVNATQRLIQSVINTVKEQTLPAQGYSDPRVSLGGLGNYSPICRPLSVRRTA